MGNNGNKKNNTLLITLMTILLFAIIYGCNVNQKHTDDSSDSLFSLATSISNTSTSSLMSSDISSLISLDAETSTINYDDHLIVITFYSNDDANITIKQKTEHGNIIHYYKKNKNNLLSDGSINKVELRYDKNILKLSLKINNLVIYEDEDPILMDVNSLLIKSNSYSDEGHLMIKNLIINDNQDLYSKTYISEGHDKVILQPHQAPAITNDNIHTIKFNFVILHASNSGDYDSISVVLGIKS